MEQIVFHQITVIYKFALRVMEIHFIGVITVCMLSFSKDALGMLYIL